MSRVSDDYVTPISNVGHVDESSEVENTFPQLSDDDATANGTASLQESNVVEDKVSQVSDNCVTPADASRLDADNEVGTNTFGETQNFSCLEFGSSIDTDSGIDSSQPTHSYDSILLATSCDESCLNRNNETSPQPTLPPSVGQNPHESADGE